MKQEEMQINEVYYSQRHNSYGLCIDLSGFMAYMFFTDEDHPSGWYHCIELFWDQEAASTSE